MSKARKMNIIERRVYNQAQALYKKAQEERDRAIKMYEDRLKGEADELKRKRELKEAADKAAEKDAQVQAFSVKINNLCVALGAEAKKQFLSIDGGPDSMWGIDARGVKIFTVVSNAHPRMMADVYAVARKGFRWEIKS
jgi:hypothetical protein